MNSEWRDERGQALVMVSFALIAILAILGLTVDVGWAFFRKQAAQTAVESAALAAVQAAQKLSATFTCGADVECPSTPSACPSPPISSTLSPSYNNLQIGCSYANLNGFSAAGVQNVTMAAGTGAPSTVPNVSTNYWVTARATESIPQLFSAIIPGHTSIVSSARATAGIVNFALSGCVYLLSTSGTALTDSASASINATFCSINVNSNSASAVNMTGSGNINAATLNVVGPSSCAGKPTCGISKSGSGGFGSTTINTGIATFSDPLAAVQPPPLGTCKAAVNDGSSSPLSLSPGTYCGGIKVSGSGSVTFSPGVYILDGGGLTLTGSGAVTGSGVMFYNTFDSTHPFAPVDITSGSSSPTTLSAPSSGPYQGLLIFESRSAPASTDSITGSTNLNLVGNLYFKNSTLDLTGSGSSTDVAVVANQLVMTGSGNFNETNLSSASGPSAPVISLIE
jgi:Putative Flp pilus-assembly TadE/G-like